jgi:alpha-beta hydrolase superfamily lysophospholipase
MPSVTGRVDAADGTELLTRHWLLRSIASGTADSGRPWGSVLLLHGLGEHSGRYEHVGDQLADAGLDVHAYDQRGNGESGGQRGHVERWTQLHEDLAQRLTAIRAAAGAGTVVLYAHSMGALVAAGYLLDDWPKPDLAVLSSPGLDSTHPGWKKGLARLLGGIAPTLALRNDLDGTTLSRDPAVAEKVRVDPAAAKVTTARFGAEALGEQARIRRDVSRGFGIPVLVLHGLDDGLVPASASEVLASVPGVERRTYPGLRHELHNEPEGSQIVDEVLAWIRERGTLDPQPNTASGERIER